MRGRWGLPGVALVAAGLFAACATPPAPPPPPPSTTTAPTAPATTTPTSVAPTTTTAPGVSSTTTSAPATTTTVAQPDPAERAGLTDPAALTDYSGPSVISGGTVVIEDKRFAGRLTVRGGDVTIRNSTFDFDDYYHVLVEGGTVLIEHSAFDGRNTTTNADDLGATGSNLTVRWSTFRGLVNALRLGDDSTAENNVISDPNDAVPSAHSDGIEVYGGSNVVIRGNRIDIAGGAGETGCVNIATDFGDIDGVVVEDNDFTGGTYSLYVRSSRGSSVGNVVVRGNRWHTPHMYGTHSVDPRSAVVEWSGNTLDGRPVGL